MPQYAAPWVPLQPDGTPSSKQNYVNLGTGAIQQLTTSATRLFRMYVVNSQASTATYIQVFDSLVANITLGTTTPDEMLLVPGSASGSIQFPVYGQLFTTAVAVQATTTAGGAVGSASGVYVYFSYLNP